MSHEFANVFPLDSEVDEAGRLSIGGCDAVALAREYGTPAYVVAENDLRARAREFRSVFDRYAPGSEIAFASKACPATPVLRIAQQEGLDCDVASAGELALALHAGFEPQKIHLHGNAKSDAELVAAVEHGIGQVVIDSVEEVDRLAAVAAERGVVQRVLIRVTPDVRGETHDGISTGQADSKFGLGIDATRVAIDRIRLHSSLHLDGLHFHIGSQLLELEPFGRAIEAVAPLMDGLEMLNLGGGLGVSYTPDQEPPSIEEYVKWKVQTTHRVLGDRVRIGDEPGRALVARAGVTLYTVETIKQNVSTWVAVDGGMADNLRPMLYGATYIAQIADRVGRGTACKLVGKHCESSDVLVRDADLKDPQIGDVVVTPVTGAYGHAMASTYNGLPRPPMVFVADGKSRVVIRRERQDELWARDVE